MPLVARVRTLLSRSLWLAPLLALVLSACGGGGGGGGSGPASAPPTLSRVEVTPAVVSIAAGTQRQYTAMAIYSDNSRQDVTNAVSWTSSDTTVATISSTGLASALRTGSTTITATFQGTAGSTTLTVTAAVATALAITPPNPSIANGTTQQFTATATFSDNSTQDVTTTTTWSSSAPAVATISNSAGSNGLAQAVSQGSSTIGASYNGLSASTTLTVTAATIVSLAVTPTNPSIANGTTQQFTATATFSDNTTQNVTTSATWASSRPSVATVSNAAGSNGLAHGVAVGNTLISASYLGRSDASTLTVNPATLISISVTPSSPSIALGLSQQFTATGTYTDGSNQDITTTVTWSSSNTATATISNAAGSNGLAQSQAVGSVSITAALSGITGATGLTVTAATLTRIDVTPANASVPVGRTQQYVATGVYTDSSTQDLTATVTWSTSDATIADISNAAGSKGLASANHQGSATIGASQGGISGSTTLTVGSAVLVAIQVTPTNASLARGFMRPFTATGIYSDNSNADITTAVTWSSTNTGTATISNAAGSQGVANGVAAGTTTISATQGSIAGSTTLTVTPATLTSINVQPTNPSIALGFNQQFTATGTFSYSTTLSLTTQVNWTSGTPATATISNAAGSQGLASSAATGTTQITASSGTVSGNTTLTVTAATITAITVTAPAASVPAGVSQQYTATATYSDGTTGAITNSVTWSSSNTAAATISNAAGSNGLATAVAAGATTISAVAQGVTGSTPLTVTAAVLNSIAVTPANRSVPLGVSPQFTATGTYSDNSSRDITADVTWTSGTPSVATISNANGSAGLATTIATGTTAITAAIGNTLGSTNLTVTGVALTSIAVTPSGSSAPAGTSVQFTAIGTYSDGSTQDLTQGVTWSSTQTAIADISNSAGSRGVAFAKAVGSARIAATDPVSGVSADTGFTVTAAVLRSIAVAPMPQTGTSATTLPAGYSRQYVASGIYSDGSVADLTTQVSWTTFAAATATVGDTATNKGLVQGVAAGTTTISATMPGSAGAAPITGSTGVTITKASLSSIAVTPANASIPRSGTQQFVAVGTFSDSSTLALTTQVTWASSNTAVATISNAAGSQGLATAAALRVGTSTITAALNTVTSNGATLTVTLN